VHHVQGRRGIAIEARHPGVLLAVTAAVIITLDQVTKAVVRSVLDPGSSVPVVKGWLYLTHVRNTGAAFGLMPGQRGLFILTSLLVLVAIGLYWWRARPRSLVLALSLGLVSGGAVGNLVDRVLSGRVTDFLDTIYIPIFNVADMAIVGGAVGLFAWALFAPIEHHDEAPAVEGVPVGPDAPDGTSPHASAGRLTAPDPHGDTADGDW